MIEGTPENVSKKPKQLLEKFTKELKDKTFLKDCIREFLKELSNNQPEQ